MGYFLSTLPQWLQMSMLLLAPTISAMVGSSYGYRSWCRYRGHLGKRAVQTGQMPKLFKNFPGTKVPHSTLTVVPQEKISEIKNETTELIAAAGTAQKKLAGMKRWTTRHEGAKKRLDFRASEYDRISGQLEGLLKTAQEKKAPQSPPAPAAAPRRWSRLRGRASDVRQRLGLGSNERGRTA